jgi:hypothetical protein
MELLPIDWYFQSPIDFEHKEYILYAYLKEVDESFNDKRLSPHLLHIEKLLNELKLFYNSYKTILFDLEKTRYKYFDNPHLGNLDNDDLLTIVDIIEFSKPQLNNRWFRGQTIFKKYNQILY